MSASSKAQMVAEGADRERGPIAVRALLLPPTVQHARERSPFWRARIEATGHRDPAAAFHALPPLTKAEAAAAGEDLYATGYDRREDRVVISSGTRREGRAVLFVRRQPEEARALARFEQVRAAHYGPKATKASKSAAVATSPPSVVELWNVAHGLPQGPPRPGTFRAPWTAHPNFPELAFAALEDAYRWGEGRITAVRGSVSALLTLVAAARAFDIDLRRFGVSAIGTNAYEVTGRARRLLREAFGCACIVDSYSLSEFTTPAPEDLQTGWHHFAEPPLLAEVLVRNERGEETIEPLAEGLCGRLVLTGLYPFMQRTPLLRYDTGDLIEVGPYDPRHEDLGFRPLGRACDAVEAMVDGVRRVVVYPSHLFRLADEEPGIARTLHPVERLGVVPVSDLGAPRIYARGGPEGVRVEFTPRPGLSAGALGALRERLRARLLAANRELARFVEAGGRFEIEAVEAGTLPDTLFKP